MRRTFAAAIGTLSVAAAITGTGLAAASASPATSGTERFQVVTTSATTNKLSVIATGAFTAGGTDIEGRTTATERFPGGSFKIRHHKTGGTRGFNPRTCLLTVSQHGTYTIGHGTGKFAGISGHGKYQIRILAVGARSGGKCTQKKPPVAFQLIIRASGPVSLP